MTPAAKRPKPPNAGKGRKKGVPNKSTASVKAALTSAFDQIGGVGSLVTWGRANQSEFYTLWAKLLPKEITGPDGDAIQVAHSFVFGDREIRY